MSETDLRTHLLAAIESGITGLNFPEKPTTLYQPYEYALGVGGKRIRPLLTVLANGMCGGNEDDAFPAAMAVEILHNFTLVHDDIMDSADTRRGKPSVFKKWDENVAILSGDVMFADALQQLNYYGESESFSKEEYYSLNQTFLKAIVTVCEGQALDMEFVDRADVSLGEYLTMISGKTAALLSGALAMGSITAHADTDSINKLHELGLNMGLAFQIQDDLLDATADPEKFGKRPGGDIFEGKKTYLTILALDRGNEQQKTLIQNTLDSDQPSEESVTEVLQIMEVLDVLKDVSKEVSNRYSSCLQLVSEFQNSKYKKELENLLIFLQNRDH
ncbi:MAG: polyprenyl synthetase family protein [Balneolales bacterium]|nr:polyprenyl synthetase family protein [Balneolales bacterium]